MKRSWRHIVAGGAITVLAAGVPAVMAATPAMAATHPVGSSQLGGFHDNTEICNAFNGGNTPFFCLNAWNGGPDVKSYQAGTATNNNFFVQAVSGRCGSGDHTTSGCPVAGIEAGLLIYQAVYGNNTSKCLGTIVSGADTGAGILTGCNNPNTGFGGGTGTIQIAFPGGCRGAASSAAINAYWSGQDGAQRGILINTSNGEFMFLNSSDLNCLGQFSD